MDNLDSCKFSYGFTSGKPYVYRTKRRDHIFNPHTYILGRKQKQLWISWSVCQCTSSGGKFLGILLQVALDIITVASLLQAGFDQDYFNNVTMPSFCQFAVVPTSLQYIFGSLII